MLAAIENEGLLDVMVVVTRYVRCSEVRGLPVSRAGLYLWIISVGECPLTRPHPWHPRRYFGGIKLGTGGLVRAYGGVARTCLRAGQTEVRVPRVELLVVAPIASAGAVYGALAKVERLGEEYTEEEVRVRIRVEASAVEAVARLVRDGTKGAGRIEEVG